MNPTRRQLEALRFIRGYQLASGSAPSNNELRAALGLRSSSGPARLIDCLEERGLLRRRRTLGGERRDIEVLTDIPVPRDPDGTPLYFVAVP